jgi:hypothetical protein
MFLYLLGAIREFDKGAKKGGMKVKQAVLVSYFLINFQQGHLLKR